MSAPPSPPVPPRPPRHASPACLCARYLHHSTHLPCVQVYERAAITAHMELSNLDPMSRQPLLNKWACWLPALALHPPQALPRVARNAPVCCRQERRQPLCTDAPGQLPANLRAAPQAPLPRPVPVPLPPPCPAQIADPGLRAALASPGVPGDRGQGLHPAAVRQRRARARAYAVPAPRRGADCRHRQPRAGARGQQAAGGWGYRRGVLPWMANPCRARPARVPVAARDAAGVT